MQKRIWFVILSVLLMTSVVLSGCQLLAEPGPTDSTPPAAETPAPDETPAAEQGETPEADEEPLTPGEVSVTFWSAPNPPQEAFWAEMAQQYMEENPNVRIQVRAMPEAPTSEAGILAAIAGGNPPTASENIFIGFGGELSRNEAIIPLNELDGWDDLLATRSMEQSIEGWEFGDGNYYILPIYSNAMLWGWRIDRLQELGINEVPRTYSEIIEVGRTLREDDPNQFVWARQALAEDTWWERWFDFFILYYAASNGQPLITENEITADDEAAVQVLTWLQQLAQENLLLTQPVTDPFETGVSLSTQLGPWTFSAWAEQYPDLQLDENFVLTPPPVPDDHTGEEVNTFADAKGIVIYSQASEEEQQAIWEFIQWVYSNPENDLAWMERTNLPPARDDLATNEAFRAFFEENPELLAYAEQLPLAVPPMDHPEFTEIQAILGQQAVIPVIMGQKEPEQAWQDWRTAVEPILQQ